VGAIPDGVSSSISQTFVYDNPTLSAMAKNLASLMSGKGDPPVFTKEDAIRCMITKYSTFMPFDKTQIVSQALVVLLTGSTGSLGSHILEVFLRGGCLIQS
jgi:FlaA1/EpsC-like NDP-sugar epimerase